MIDIIHDFSSARVFTNELEAEAELQIWELLEHPCAKGSKIRFMPDVHPGIGCTIGTTMTITDKVVPYMVGVDIWCGVDTVIITNKNINLEYLDRLIKANIPHSTTVRKEPLKYEDLSYLDALYCVNNVDLERAKLSLGTLGGGNHFIEVNKDEDGLYYINVHSGSRYLGKQVANYYQNLAVRTCKDSEYEERKNLIESLKAQGRQREIEQVLKDIKTVKVTKTKKWLEGEEKARYLYDMRIVQYYARHNRHIIMREILDNNGLNEYFRFSTVHNYIDIENMILRKGAVSAEEGKILTIPINMRDGCLLCVGKGNKDWNCSAPHGAGRVMSRSKVKQTVTMDEYKKAMEGVYTSCVCDATLDESPQAYKSIGSIMANIGDTVDVKRLLKPVYNFKSTESIDYTKREGLVND